MNINEFNELVSESPMTIVKFGTQYCSPCKTVEATLDNFFSGIEGLNIIKIDAEDEPELSMHFKIRSVPVLLYYKDGELKDKTVGNVSQETINEKIESLKK